MCPTRCVWVWLSVQNPLITTMVRLCALSGMVGAMEDCLSPLTTSMPVFVCHSGGIPCHNSLNQLCMNTYVCVCVLRV